MPTIPVVCPGCSARMNCPQELLGKRITCPTCGTGFAAAPPAVPVVASLPEPAPYGIAGTAAQWADVAVVAPLPEPAPPSFRAWVLPAVAVPAFLLGLLLGYFLPHPSEASAPQRELGDQRKDDEGPFGQFGRSKETRAKLGAHNLEKALTVYFVDHQQFPADLAALTQKDDRGGPYIDAEGLLDPWGKQYQVDVTGRQHNGVKPDVWTISPENGNMIGNWGRRWTACRPSEQNEPARRCDRKPAKQQEQQNQADVRALRADFERR